MVVAHPAPDPPGNRPFWIPTNVQFDSLPQALQAAIIEIVNPAYQELVLEAPSPLEKAAGLSLVHLLWLEIVEQYDLGRAMARMLPRGESSAAHQEAIGRHLRLVGVKERFGKFVLQLRAWQEKSHGRFGLPGAGPA
jgi:hypothetical protein